MRTLVECVPNFSEGRDRLKIDKITSAIKSVPGITLLDVDPGADTNRTVVTFVGAIEAVEEAAFRGISRASELIDMSKHKGAHPRMGATDVCPFIPVKNVSMEDCVKLSRRVAARIGQELDFPVYLYEYSASKPEWKNLATIREGEYEAIHKKITRSEWKPDFGPAEFRPGPGATAVGAREFLIAYNINLNTRDERLATDIAFELREKGRSVRTAHPKSMNYLDGEIIRYGNGVFPCGNCPNEFNSYDNLKKHVSSNHDYELDAFLHSQGFDIDNLGGKPVRKPGLFKDVKAIGWYIDSFKRAQISINFTNYKVSPIHEVYDATVEIAETRGVRVTGSELVGLVPLKAITMAGEYYLSKQGLSRGIPERDIVETAIQSLGLNEISPFDADEKIIDYAVSSDDEHPLMEMTSTAFIDFLSTNSPAPGGGSVSALVGSLGAALVSMVSTLSHDRKEYLNDRERLNMVGVSAQKIKDQLSDLVDRDSFAFNDVLAANRINANTPEEKQKKEEAILQANKNAIEVPITVVKLSLDVLKLANSLIGTSFSGSVSDAGVAGEAGFAAARGAAMNVLINLPGVKKDDTYYNDIMSEIDSYMKEAEKLEKQIFNKTLQIINES